MITPEKRRKMEKLIYDTFSALDKTGRNTARYKEKFSSMSDTQFDNFFKNFFKNPNQYLILNICDYEIDLRIDDIEDAAKVLKIPLFERVAMPYLTMDKENVIISKEPVPVGYVHVKRTQQTVAKKNGMSTSIASRAALTGQVTGKDKNGRESDLENSMLISRGMTEVLKELNGPRADDLKMKQDMLTDISTKGYTRLADLESDPVNKTTLNTVDVFMLGMGIKSDLVTKGLMLKKTLKEEA